MTADRSRPPIDVTSVALHVLALAVWPIACGYATFRLLADRYGPRRPR
jgi:hypothetical protein